LWRSSNDHVLALDAVGARRSTSSHLVLVAALASSDRGAEAREALQRYLALPSVGTHKTIAEYTAHQTSLGSDPRFVEMNERMYDGLRKAGMQEE